MRILLYANRVADPVRAMTGVGRYVSELPGALADAAGADELMLCAPPEPGGAAWLDPRVVLQRRRGGRAAVNASWLVVRRPLLDRLVERFDLLHVLHPSFPVPTARPAVLTIHDLFPVQFPEWSAPVERVAFTRALDLAIGGGWVLVADSEFVAGQVRSLPGVDGSRVVTAPLGVSGAFARPVGRAAVDAACHQIGVSPDRYLVAVGRANRRKNLPVVLDALGRLGPAGPPLVLAGARPGDLGGLVGSCPPAGVRATGFVADDQLAALVAGARALVHPSVVEGFGLPVLEAMAAGTAVIASAGGSLPEITAGAAVLVDPRDPAAWAAAIQRLMVDDDLRRDLRRAGPLRAAGFTWGATAAAVRRAYEMATER